MHLTCSGNFKSGDEGCPVGKITLSYRITNQLPLTFVHWIALSIFLPSEWEPTLTRRNLITSSKVLWFNYLVHLLAGTETTFPSDCKYSCYYGKERSSQQNKDHMTYWVYFSVFLPVTLDTSLIFDNWMKWYLEVSISDREDRFHSSS